MDFEYTGAVQTTTLAKGKYTIECWGAQGGGTNGGKGGYSIGTLTLAATTDIFVYVGGQDTNTGSYSTGGFNGGGSGGYGGGGASDVRLGTDSLYARVIVAGGGGGYGSYGTGGVGGGTSGGDGDGYSTYCAGKGATQTTAGEGASGIQYAGNSGSFGSGGASYNSASCGGGGGGWYGGGGSGYNRSNKRNRYGSAGGGSGYVYTSDTASNYPSGCLLDSTHYLTDASTVDGSTSITSPTGTTETGHAGNGYVRITVIPTAPEPPTYADVTFVDYFSASFYWEGEEENYKYIFNGTTYSTTSKYATVHGMVADTTYQIKICAYNDYGDSDWIEISIRAPSANFKQTMWDYQSLSLKWDAAKYATSYILKRNGSQIASQTGTTFTDTELSPSTSYTYQLYAVRSGTQSLVGTLTGKTENGRIVQQVEFNSVSLTPNPTTINTSLDLKVTCEDKTVLYTGEKFFSNEIYSGEV